MQLEKIEAICTYPTPLCMYVSLNYDFFFQTCNLHSVFLSWPFENDWILDLTWKTLVFCFENCSDLLWQKKFVVVNEKNFWKFEAEGQEFGICLRKPQYSNNERSEQVLKQNTFELITGDF